MEGEVGRGAIAIRGQLACRWVQRISKVMIEAARRSQPTCCFVMDGFKLEYLLLSNVFQQVGCK